MDSLNIHHARTVENPSRDEVNHPGVSARPAALPALCFAAGIAAAPILTAPLVAAVGLALAGVLLIRLRGPRSGLVALCLAAGVVIGARATAEEDRLIRLPRQSDRFSVVAVPLHNSWTRNETGFRLTAPHFAVDGERVSRSITVYLATPPPVDHHAASVLVEGFLTRREDGSFMLSCKSPRLVSFRGRASRLHPRYWNRRADQELTRLASERPVHQRAAALAKALALGRSGELPSQLREDYRRGGTYHLLVFSGMQIAFAAGAIAFVLRRRSPRSRDVALLVLAWFAPLFAGNEPSVTRAASMIGLYAATRLLKRPTSLENLFFVSAAIRLALVPSELSDPGFALTYAATGGLLFIGRPLARAARRRVVAATAYSFGAEIATIPLTLHYFHQYVAGGSLVTLLLAPLLGAMFLASAIASAMIFVSDDASAALLHLVRMLDFAATEVNHWFGEDLRLARVGLAPPGALVATVFAAVVALLSFRAAPLLLSCALLATPFCYSAARARLLANTPHPEITFFDVQQGDAILIRSGRSAVLVDTGGRRGDSDFARRVLLPKLLDRGVRRLDAVVISHPHPDHCGALVPLLQSLAVRELWIAPAHLREGCVREGANQAFDEGMVVRLARPKDRLHLPSVRLDLHPAVRPFKRADMNNSSIVIAADLNGRRALLTGDVEREREWDLLSTIENHEHFDLLKVAHHGSRSSTSEPFLREAAPSIAVLSCGRRNPFGHPHVSVVQRLTKSGVRLWRTDRHGDIRVVFGERGVHLTPQIDTPRASP